LSRIVQMADERKSHNAVTQLLKYSQFYVKSGVGLEDSLKEIGRASGHSELKHVLLALSQVAKFGGEISKQLQDLADAVGAQREAKIEDTKPEEPKPEEPKPEEEKKDPPADPSGRGPPRGPPSGPPGRGPPGRGAPSGPPGRGAPGGRVPGGPPPPPGRGGAMGPSDGRGAAVTMAPTPRGRGAPGAGRGGGLLHKGRTHRRGAAPAGPAGRAPDWE
jgi:hypothetical protein